MATHNPDTPFSPDTIAMLDALPVAAMVLTSNLEVLTWNRAATDLLGWTAPEVVGTLLPGLSVTDRLTLAALLERTKDTGQQVRSDLTISNSGGELLAVEVSVSQAPERSDGREIAVGVFVGVNQSRWLRQACDAKSDALARFASRVAHDFNNILTNVNAAAHAIHAADAANHSSDAQNAVQQILAQVKRASKLTADIAALGLQNPPGSAQMLNANALITRLASKWRKLLGERVTLGLALCGEPVLAAYDPIEFDKVMVALLDNARDALPDGGEVTVRTECLDSVEDDGAGGTWSAKISVSDNGPGVAGAVAGRLFEPFVTTKRGGSGVSLAVAYRAVRSLGGLLTHERESGQTVFSMYLARRHHAGDARELVTAEQSMSGSGGTETILLVEDDHVLKEVIATMLRSFGYVVFEAATWQEALATHESNSAAIQLLVADVLLPQGTGRTLSEALTTAQPTLRTLYISGYQDSNLRDKSLLPAGVPFIQKPFTHEALARAVRAVLDHNTDRETT